MTILATRMGPYEGVMLLVLVASFGAMMLFSGRKEKKERREHESMLNALEKGDSVVTSCGFYGVVQDVADEIVIVEFGNNKNCRIPMKKNQIVEVEKA